jgi:hypothetical protein
MTFDLRTYVAAHRCRVRNLHDGEPVPPTRRPHEPGRRAVYRSQGDCQDAIICRDGYVTIAATCRACQSMNLARGAIIRC